MTNNIDEVLKYSQNMRLLYVEDNKDAREMTSIMLKDFFYDVVVGVNGLDGYEKFLDNDIDFIMTDINMPKLNGLDMIKKIKKLKNNIPVLILSAYNEIEYFKQSDDLGIEGYLLKPIDIDKLIDKMVEILKNTEFTDSDVD